MQRPRKSWKTSSGGLVMAAGAALNGAAQLNWMTVQERHFFMLLGYVLTVAGPLIIGFQARDYDISDQDAGLRPEPPPTAVVIAPVTLPHAPVPPPQPNP